MYIPAGLTLLILVIIIACTDREAVSEGLFGGLLVLLLFAAPGVIWYMFCFIYALCNGLTL